MDTKNALLGIFTQINTGDEATRERCLKFISTKVLAMGPSIITREVEEFLIGEIKKVLQVRKQNYTLTVNVPQCYCIFIIINFISTAILQFLTSFILFVGCYSRRISLVHENTELHKARHYNNRSCRARQIGKRTG